MAENRSSQAMARRKLYASPRWRRERKVFLRLNPHCIECGGKAIIVDHRAGHGQGWEQRFWDQSLWQPMCQPCHSAKTNKENPTLMRGQSRPRGPGDSPYGHGGEVKTNDRGRHHGGLNGIFSGQAKNPKSKSSPKSYPVNPADDLAQRLLNRKKSHEDRS